VRTIEVVVTRREEREWSVYTGSRVGCGALNEEEILKEKGLGKKHAGVFAWARGFCSFAASCEGEDDR
jgi:hypothetical protein